MAAPSPRGIETDSSSTPDGSAGAGGERPTIPPGADAPRCPVAILGLDRLRGLDRLLGLLDDCDRHGRPSRPAEDVVELVPAQGEARLDLPQPLREVLGVGEAGVRALREEAEDQRAEVLGHLPRRIALGEIQRGPEQMGGHPGLGSWPAIGHRPVSSS